MSDRVQEYLSTPDPRIIPGRTPAIGLWYDPREVVNGERDQRLENLLNRFREEGGRITGSRVGILRALLVGHRSADEIYTEVKRGHPSISRGTVYKTLEALRALGEVRELELGVGRAHFDGMRPEAHPHTICPMCGKIEDVELASLPALKAEAEALGLDFRLDLFGPCPNCINAKDSP